MISQAPSSKKSLRKWVYGFLSVFFVTLAIFVVTSIRELLLPILVGGFLAYIFKPLIRKNFIPQLPKWIGTTLVVSLVLGSATYVVKKVIARQPDEIQKIELMIRAKYKVNKKFEDLFAVDYAKDQGNFFYESFKADLKKVILTTNDFLILSPEQAELWSSFVRGESGSQHVFNPKFNEYFEANLKHPVFGKALAASIAGKKVKEVPVTSNPGGEGKSNLSEFFHLLSIWLLTPLVFVFLLFDKGEILKFFIGMVPNKYFEMALTIVDEVDMAIGKYIRSTVLECSLLGASIGLPLLLVGLEFKICILIGFLAGVTHAIPFLGPVVGLGAGISYSIIAEDISPLLPFVTVDNLSLMVFGVILFAILLDNMIYQPLIIGHAVDLHPLVVVVGVIGGSFMFGVVGMLFAIPSIVIVKTVVETSLRELKAYKYL